MVIKKVYGLHTTYDLEDYFHHFLLNKKDTEYVGYQVFGKQMIALYSPYGVAAVPRIACTHSELSTVPFHRQVTIDSKDTHKMYVDDGTIIHHDNWKLHLNCLLAFKNINNATLKEKVKKRHYCVQQAKIYGWMFDTQYTPLLLYLPFDKRVKINKLLNIIIKVEYCDIKFLFKVTGTLMHYSQINKIIKIICIKFIRII